MRFIYKTSRHGFPLESVQRKSFLHSLQKRNKKRGRNQKKLCGVSCAKSPGQAMSNTRFFDKEHRSKISEKNKGHLVSSEQREKIKKALTGRRKYKSMHQLGADASLKKYRIASRFRFDLKKFKGEFDFGLVEKFGWYSPTNKKNNLAGVSRDHMFSVRDGFDLGVDPNTIAHPANCRLVLQKENTSKNRKSSITLNFLLDKIKEWDEKYGSIAQLGERSPCTGEVEVSIPLDPPSIR